MHEVEMVRHIGGFISSYVSQMLTDPVPESAGGPSHILDEARSTSDDIYHINRITIVKSIDTVCSVINHGAYHITT